MKSIYKKCRIEHELTQKQMAEALNISLNAYRHYEKGERLIPAKILIRFLEFRNEENDLKLAGILKEIYEK